MRPFYTLIAFFFLNILFCTAQTTDVVTGLTNPSRLLLDGNTLYFSSSTEIFKIDVTQSSPTPVSVIAGLNGGNGMAIGDNILYFSEFNGGKISKIDLTDPTPIKETVIAGLTTPAELVLSGNTLYFSDPNNSGVYQFDITDTNPTPLLVAYSNFNFNPSGLALQGNILYMGQGIAERVSKVDVTSGILQPEDVVTLLERPLGIRVLGNKIYIAEYIGNKISVKDLTAGASVAEDLVTGLNKPTDLEIWGNTLFMLEKGDSKITKIALPLGVDDFNANAKITLFPNPSSDFITLSNLQEPAEYFIYTIDGSVVRNGKLKPGEQLNISNLTNGTYLLSLNKGDSFKFVKF